MLSIIIPVYRVEATLDRCVESVVRQSYRDIEVILVDDGSPDHCPQLCDAWAGRDGRIRVIHQKNGGLSDARNTGIDAARGEWLTFVDSDDFLGEETLRQVMAVVKDEHDIVEFPVCHTLSNGKTSMLTFTPQVYEDMEEYWLKGRAYEHTYAWNKIYRTKLFDEVRFPKRQAFEDVHTLPLLLKRARRVATTDQGFYHYCQNPNGITATADGEALTSLLHAHLAAGWMDDRSYMCILNIQIDVFEQADGLLLLPYRPVSICTSELSLSNKVKALLLRWLGVKGVCRLCHAGHKMLKMFNGKC